MARDLEEIFSRHHGTILCTEYPILKIGPDFFQKIILSEYHLLDCKLWLKSWYSERIIFWKKSGPILRRGYSVQSMVPWCLLKISSRSLAITCPPTWFLTCCGRTSTTLCTHQTMSQGSKHSKLWSRLKQEPSSKKLMGQIFMLVMISM
jgi:hypothetical protein